MNFSLILKRYIDKIKVQMKKLNINDVNWNEIQAKHDSGVLLNKLGISRKMLYMGILAGVFTKNKITYKHTNEAKRKISEKRKTWLKQNPDKHPWIKNSKFMSVPCEQLKKFLSSVNIEFIEEAIISNDKNYSVDILLPSKKLIIEVNGNQHYDKNGTLLPYYQSRHDYISSLGWKVLEIHYTLSYNHEYILNLIQEEDTVSSILPFKLKKDLKKSNKIYGSREDYNQAKRKEWVTENQKLIPIVLNSGIDFSKFGWVSKLSLIINKKPQKIKQWMKQIMPDFYKTHCFKRV